MASKAAQIRLAEEQRRQSQIKAILTDAKKAVVADEKLDPSEFFKDFKEQFFRPAEQFRSKLKSSDQGKQILEAARHLFCKYKVPAILESIWLGSHYSQKAIENYHHARRYGQHNFREAERQRQNRVNHNFRNNPNILRNWFVCVATGGSLYKDHTRALNFTKRETFMFLSANSEVMSASQALVWAIAMCAQGSNLGVASRLSQTNFDQKNVFDPFWQDAIRFFCLEGNHPSSVKDVNDLLDYITQMRQDNPNFRLLGSSQSLAAVQRRCEQWHRSLARQKVIGNNTWEGAPLHNWKYVVHEGEKNEETWSITQINCGKDLAAEGTAMNHCVLSYASRCVNGQTSIWSVRRTTRDFIEKRAVTVEMNSFYEICQVRGISNRVARADEKNVIQRWAQENALQITNYAFG